MTNYGNTGQRYKMPKIENVTTDTVNGELYVVWELACGHSRYILHTWEGELEAHKKYIGGRTRCNRCTK